jgi:hypothetical protein
LGLSGSSVPLGAGLCPTELTALLHTHLTEFGDGPDGRVFTGERNTGELPKVTVVRAWQRAWQAVFTPEVAAGQLVRSPYDLRHAAVSAWFNGGIPATKVAEWAGHSVEVLLMIYAKCLDGGDAQLRRRVEAALGITTPAFESPTLRPGWRGVGPRPVPRSPVAMGLVALLSPASS